ncbi:SDR family NAD(P)-dependent oxidoreductase [Novosphingobium tardum]|uniref:SDR family NAD(P)-dependent oxidoreductase n=1 Tax=Novosphingobium tardum TaxID=1538021 RepID=A0ABV8RU10_9SPHN
MQLSGKKIVVTGGARGIGAAAVRAFVREGALVHFVDLLDEEGKELAANVTASGPGRAVYHHGNVAERTEMRAIFARCADDMSGIDSLVHAAGIHREAPPELITDEDWDTVIAVNLRGTFVTNQEAFPYLKENEDSRIINFGSLAGMTPYVMSGHYSASKGGVIAWTRTIAHAWGKHGIRANTMAPGIESPMAAEVRERLTSKPISEVGASPTASAALASGMGDADRDLAPVLVFLLTDGARHITAQIISVDGGICPTR